MSSNDSSSITAAPGTTELVTSTTSTPTTSGTSTPQPTSKPSRKPRCAAKNCKSLAQPIIGDCGFCSLKFCGKHRMLESHNCAGLEDCKKVERERNRHKLEGERTVAIRGL